MSTCEPSERIWRKVNAAIMGENSAEIVATLLSGICAVIRDSGVAEDEDEARVVLAATILSPSDRPVGSLADRLPAEIDRLRNDGAWVN